MPTASGRRSGAVYGEKSPKTRLALIYCYANTLYLNFIFITNKFNLLFFGISHALPSPSSATISDDRKCCKGLAGAREKSCHQERRIEANKLRKINSRAARLRGDEVHNQLLGYQDLLNWTRRNSKEHRQRLNQQ